MTTLQAFSLAQDPRIKQAKKLLLAAVQEYQQTLVGIRAPDPALVDDYRERLAQLAELRAGKTYFPFLGSGIGNGALVELMDGSVKYDFISGIGVHYLGHSHPDIVAASLDAALSDTVMQGHLQQNADTIPVLEELTKASGLPHCFLTTSGAMANENALKLAFQKHFPATRVLAFNHCFMGRTWALSQITDKALYRQGLPLSIQVDYVPFYDPQHPEQSTDAALLALKEYIARYPKQHAVMVYELIQGEGGFNIGSPDFFHRLMTLCKEHNIAVIVDEVQTFGRLPSLFAFQYFGLQDLVDIVSIGKLSQVCATLFSKEYSPKPGLLSQTFTGSTASLHAARVILRYLLHEGFLGPEGKIAQVGSYFTDKLQALAIKYPDLIQGPFGLGAMVAFTPLGGHPQPVARFVHNLFNAGVISFIAGSEVTRVRFLVPVGGIKLQDIDAVCTIVEQTLVLTAQELKSNTS